MDLHSGHHDPRDDEKMNQGKLLPSSSRKRHTVTSKRRDYSYGLSDKYRYTSTPTRSDVQTRLRHLE